MTVTGSYIEGTIIDTAGYVIEIDSLLTESSSTFIGNLVEHNRLILANGNNTITIPPTLAPSRVIITCNPLCNTVKILKGIAGDTGLRIFSTIAGGQNSGTFMFRLGVGVPGFVINSAGADSDYTEFLYI